MLVLSRKIGETFELFNASSTTPLTIQPGEKIGEVILVDVRGARVRVGAEFPDTIRIKRKEIPVLSQEPQTIVIKTGRSGVDAVAASDNQEHSVE
jgi:sRNA-binding carbon storage regulator CsrA